MVRGQWIIQPNPIFLVFRETNFLFRMMIAGCNYRLPGSLVRINFQLHDHRNRSSDHYPDEEQEWKGPESFKSAVP
jgi:hypothetical protein